MTSPHAQATSSPSSRSAAPKVLLALAMACVSTLLMSCQYYPSSYGQPNNGASRQPAYGYQAPTAQGQRAQGYSAPSYQQQQGYSYPQSPATYSVSNNPVTNTAQAWARRAQSRKPVYPTSNGSQGARGKRRLPNATTGVIGLPPQQLPPNYVRTAPVAAPVAQPRVPTRQPYPANNWQGAPTYPQTPGASLYPTTSPGAPAGYGPPANQFQGTDFSNVAYTPHPGGGASAYGATAAAGGTTYIIQKGDSLSAIASRHQVPLGTLMQVNGLNMSSVIHPQQTLTIPGR